MTHARRIPVQDYMTGSLLFANERDSILSAYERLQKSGVQQLPVLDHGKLVGVVFQRDLALVEHLPGQATEVVTVGAIMTRKFYTVGPEDAVDVVAREMARHKYHAALVVRHEQPVGVFTTTDALRALSDALTDSLPEAASAS
jgi:acetoin utilization protein AcuB